METSPDPVVAPSPLNRARGKYHRQAKVANAAASVIRHAYAEGGISQMELACWFGVSQATISLVVTGKRRPDLGGPVAPPRPGTIFCHGENNPSAKLSDDDVALIRNARGRRTETVAELAKRFYVSPANIYMVIWGRTWKHAEGTTTPSGHGPARGEKNGSVKLDDATVAKILDLHAKREVSQEELARRFKVSRRTIGKIVQRKIWRHVGEPLDYKIKPRTKLDAAKVTEILDAYAKGGVSQKELARRFGVRRSTIGAIVRCEIWRHVGRPLPYKIKPHAKLNAADVIRIRDAYAGGVTLEELAQRYGVSWSNIGRIVRRETWKDVSPPVVWEDVGNPSAPPESCPFVLGGIDDVWHVMGKPKPPLRRGHGKRGAALYDTVKALVNTWSKRESLHVTWSYLERVSGHGGARGLLRRFARSDPDVAAVIDFAGRGGRGGCRLVNPSSCQRFG